MINIDAGEGGRGGHGGHGGEGGYGGGPDGVAGGAGSPGEPGEPGGRARSVSLIGLLASSGTLIVAIAGGIYWLIGLETKNAFVARDLASFRENVLSLNTPLSQRVFSLEARVGEVARIQGEVRASISSMDANGTSQNRVLRRDIDLMRTEIAGQNTRCSALNEVVVKLQNDVIETRIRLQYLIEAVMPHLQGPQKKSLLKKGLEKRNDQHLLSSRSLKEILESR